MYVVLWKVIMWMLAGMCHIFDLEYETVLQWGLLNIVRSYFVFYIYRGLILMQRISFLKVQVTFTGH